MENAVTSSLTLCEISSTARLNATSFARDGLLVPLTFRTNCSADARISASLEGGSKLVRVRTFRHMAVGVEPVSRRDHRKLMGMTPVKVFSYRLGATPTVRLKATLNALVDAYPTRAAISDTCRPPV